MKRGGKTYLCTGAAANLKPSRATHARAQSSEAVDLIKLHRGELYRLEVALH